MDGSLSAADQAELVSLVEESNSKLVEVGSEGAEQSFGLGCLLGGLLVGGVVLVLYLLGSINIILAMIILAVALIGLTGVVTLSASYARANRVSETYRLLVGPEIERTLKRSEIAPASFYHIADEVLPEDAPLRAYLANFEAQ
jgi:hypothetical protein